MFDHGRAVRAFSRRAQNFPGPITMDARDILQIKPADTIDEFRPGDTVIVNVRIREGNRERVQAYQGNVIIGAHRKDRVPPTGRDFYRQARFIRCGSRTHIPSLLPDDRVGEGDPPRKGPPGEALLPPGSHRSKGPHQGAALR